MTNAGCPTHTARHRSRRCAASCVALLAIVLFAACGKKGTPPNPDRFPPGLVGVNPVNRNRVDVVFDEPMSSRNLRADEYAITNAGGDTLTLLGLALLPDNLTVTLLTAPQAKEIYTLSGVARDNAGNVTRFTRRFSGSSRPDTIPPTITSTTPALFATRRQKGVEVTFTFSKPLDTLSYPGILVLPETLRAQFQPEWQPSLTGVKFRLADSLAPDAAVCFILPPRMRDFAGNYLASAGYTAFYAESVPRPRSVKGRIRRTGQPPANAVIVLKQDEPEFAGVARTDGSFLLRADSAHYSVTALVDTNRDGRVDLSGFLPRAALPESLVIELTPDTFGTPVESLFYRSGEDDQ